MFFSGRFGVVAICGVVALAIMDFLFVGNLSADARIWYTVSVRVTLYAVAAIAAGMAASKFGWWSEHIGRAWTLFSLQFVLLTINYLLRRATPDVDAALSSTLVAANLSQIAAYWLMARALSAAGIGYLMSPAKKILLTATALAVALLLSYGPLLEQWTLLRAGGLRPGSLISVVSDVITFTLVAPLAMSALALRGGQLSWIFGFLTISVFGWMMNGAASSIADLAGGGPDAVRTIRLAGVAMAALFNAAAAATQWRAAHRTMRGLDSDG